jgi:hypothetical protein
MCDPSTGKKLLSGCRWLAFVIPATQEAEIRRMVVQSYSQANSSQDPILKNTIKEKRWWSGSRCRP